MLPLLSRLSIVLGTALLSAAVLGITFVVGCSPQAKGSHQSSGSIASSGRVTFLSAGVSSSTGSPSHIFGTSSISQVSDYTYIIVVAPSDSNKSTYRASEEGESTFEYGEFGASYIVDVDGFSVQVDHSANVDDAAGLISGEKLVIQGVAIDLTKGRLFLIDPDAAPEDMVQLSVPLPEAPTRDSSLAEFTVRTVDDLSKSNEVIRAFLGR